MQSCSSNKYLNIQLEGFSQLINQNFSLIGILLIDVDRFICFNDKYGHQEGDEVLEKIAQIIAEEVSFKGESCRIGGDEFLALFPNLELSEIVATAEKIRARVKKKFLNLPITGRLCSFDFTVCTKTETSLTVTCSVAFYPQHGKNLIAVLKAADDAMYEGAKQLGGNRIALAGIAK